MAAWICSKCTYFNSSTANACLLCGTPSAAVGNTEEEEEQFYDDDEKEAELHVDAPTPRHHDATTNNGTAQTTEPSKHEATATSSSEHEYLQCEPDHIQIFDEDSSEHDNDNDDHKQDQSAPPEPFLNRQRPSSGAPLNDKDNPMPIMPLQRQITITTLRSLQNAASDIACYNNDPLPIFETLHTFTNNLLSKLSSPTTSDAINHEELLSEIPQSLLAADGVLGFFQLLGYEANANGTGLVCEIPPTADVVENALDILDSYHSRLDVDMQTIHHTESMMDDTDEKQNEQEEKPKVEVEHKQKDKEVDPSMMLSLQQIILWCTHENMHDSHSNDLMDVLILMHREFASSLAMLRQLRARFDVDNLSYHENKDERLKTQKVVQMKIFRCLTDWMQRFWDEDFSNDAPMQQEMENWIMELDHFKFIDKWQHCNWIKPLLLPIKSEYFERRACTSPRVKFEMKYGVDRATGIPKYLESVEITMVKKNQQIQQLKAEEFADQITLMQFKVFQSISGRECLGQKWKKSDTNDAPHISEMIRQFNELTNFVTLQILWEESVKSRAKELQYMIQMAQRFRKLQNYNGLMAVFGALNAAPIHRLKFAWQRVSERYKKVFESIKSLFSHESNFKNYRTVFRDVTPPAIPYLGLFLQDLVFIEEGNAKYTKNEDLEQQGLKMINFKRCIRMMDRIKNIQEYQQTSYEEAGVLKPNEQLQKLLYLQMHSVKDFGEKEIWNMSTNARQADMNQVAPRKHSKMLSLAAISSVLWDHKD
eukprot:CAMPEP_0197074410 /NCGR_PEP_ID=MMETSP1384-20130603/211094_1 /TAXON_ID=29189 /ORGANISM="Ammonia sp." /LENGTH=763 /DNA_ID=CAMNT_0042513251 /DNA_START=2403 /DNA_END=4694 /DNA_ORIENTATION=-